MSFSRKVKEELFSIIPKSRHCMVAELAGIITLHGLDSIGNDSGDGIDRKVFTLLNKTLNIGKDVTALSSDVFFETQRMLKLTPDNNMVDEIVLHAEEKAKGKRRAESSEVSQQKRP